MSGNVGANIYQWAGKKWGNQMISCRDMLVTRLPGWGNKNQEWREGSKTLTRRNGSKRHWREKANVGHWSDWWGLGPQSLGRIRKKSFPTNANQGIELQLMRLRHQQSSLSHWSHNLACISHSILCPNTPSFRLRLEVFFLSPYPETEKRAVGGLKVIVVYQLLLSRTEMTNAMGASVTCTDKICSKNW